ncbi:MAG: hypothetical protein QG656_610 [Candidatus Hydrogenedentes bacterium]|nr:hypothetical protein [Candidatus Hydrogenedentota bacterium]
MSSMTQSDCFTIVNGPEDGTEFPVVRAPFYIGQDPACTVNPRLDSAVRKKHAEVTCVSDGYRIRRADTAPIYVNGKRVGTFRSRILRHGGLIRVGNTVLCLECAEDGLASRSHGIAAVSDAAWAIKQIVSWLFGLVWSILHGLRRVFGRLLGNWMAMVAIVIVVMIFWPQFRHTVINTAQSIWYRALALIRQ